MRETGAFSDHDVATVFSVILGTVVQYGNDTMLQEGGESLLCKILADSDLSPLGSNTDTFWTRSSGLFEELNPYGQ